VGTSVRHFTWMVTTGRTYVTRNSFTAECRSLFCVCRCVIVTNPHRLLGWRQTVRVRCTWPISHLWSIDLFVLLSVILSCFCKLVFNQRFVRPRQYLLACTSVTIPGSRTVVLKWRKHPYAVRHTSQQSINFLRYDIQNKAFLVECDVLITKMEFFRHPLLLLQKYELITKFWILNYSNENKLLFTNEIFSHIMFDKSTEITRTQRKKIPKIKSGYFWLKIHYQKLWSDVKMLCPYLESACHN
jgi:hypothetical protein